MCLAREDQLNLVQLEIEQESCASRTVQFYRTHGSIADYDLHPSAQYVLIATEIGSFYIYSLLKGEIRAKIRIESGAQRLLNDFSGLYFAVRFGHGLIAMYETGTGRRVYDFKPDASQSHFSFSSSCTHFVMMDTSASSVKFFYLDQNFVGRARRALLGQQSDISFWNKYPITISSETMLTSAELTIRNSQEAARLKTLGQQKNQQENSRSFLKGQGHYKTCDTFGTAAPNPT